MKKIRETLRKAVFSKVVAYIASGIVLSAPVLLSLQPIWHQEPEYPQCMRKD